MYPYEDLHFARFGYERSIPIYAQEFYFYFTIINGI